MTEIPAKIEVPKGSQYTPKVNQWGLIDSTNFSMNLQLKVGARVCLITNLDQIDDLMNGQWGRVVGLETKPHKCAIVKFDNPNVGIMQQRAHSELAEKYGGTPIFYHEMEFSLKCNPNLKGKIRQIPLRLSWASTIHKLQVINFIDMILL